MALLITLIEGVDAYGNDTMHYAPDPNNTNPLLLQHRYPKIHIDYNTIVISLWVIVIVAFLILVFTFIHGLIFNFDILKTRDYGSDLFGREYREMTILDRFSYHFCLVPIIYICIAETWLTAHLKR